MRKRLVFSLLGILLTGVWALAQNGQPKTLAIRGALLIDGTGRGPLANSVVLISNGKIQAVGVAESVKIPSDATVIDASGKTIMPGLVDSHIHLRNYLAPLYLYWGVTSMGDLGNVPGWALAYKDAIAKGRVAGPYLMAAGAKFDAPPKAGDPMINGERRGFETFLLGNSSYVHVTDEASANKAVAEVKERGVDAIKMYTRTDPALMKVIAAAAHRVSLPAFAHYTSNSTRLGLFTGTDEILDTGIDVHVHLYGLVKATAPQEVRDRISKGENVQAWTSLDTSKYPPLVHKMVETKMFLNPTLGMHFRRGSKYLQEFDRMNTTFLNGPIVANYPASLIRDRYAAAFRIPRGQQGPEVREGYLRAASFVKEFVDQGGKIIAGTDTGGQAGGATPGLALHLEMRMLTEIGLTPMQAIQAATGWGAEAWRKSNEFGTVEVGKRADLLLLNRNPLDDISATTDIFKIVQAGSVIDREGLAKWQDPLPRPGAIVEPAPGYPNTMMQIPFINKISPEWVTMSQKNSELTIMGENFSKDSLVLLDDRLVHVKSSVQGELKVSISPGLLKKPGTYPLAVVQPGSAGGVSNTFYLIVTAN